MNINSFEYILMKSLINFVLTSWDVERKYNLINVFHICSNLELFSVGDRCMRLNSKTLENLEIFQNLVYYYIAIYFVLSNFDSKYYT